MAYLTLFRRKFPKNSRKKSQRSGRGGGQAGWDKIPTFTENLFCMLPLNALTDEDIKTLWLPLIIYDNTDHRSIRSPFRN